MSTALHSSLSMQDSLLCNKAQGCMLTSLQYSTGLHALGQWCVDCAGTDTVLRAPAGFHTRPLTCHQGLHRPPPLPGPRATQS